MVLILSDELTTHQRTDLNLRLGSLLGPGPQYHGTYGQACFVLAPQAGDESQQLAAGLAGVKAVFPAQDLSLLEALLMTISGENSASKKTDAGADPRVAFQGERGAYSEMALHQFFGKSVKPYPRAQFKDVFDSLMDGTCPFAVLPLENALTGSIHDNFDLLLEYPQIGICGEIYQRINHNLIGLPGTNFDQVKRVFSHPQGLLQTAAFLDTYPEWERLPFYDTAGSVLHVKELESPQNVAIASTIAAEVYGLEILKPGIETNQHNYTRFGVMVRLDAQKVPLSGEVEGFKASVVFSLPHQPGALLQCMQVLGDQGLNLTKIESRPIHGRPWEYMFYLDMDISTGLERLHMALTMLQGMTEHLRVLGIYPRANTQI